ncbi:MAG: hypothetical protein ACK5UE_01540 [Chitinophagales bacterium]
MLLKIVFNKQKEKNGVKWSASHDIKNLSADKAGKKWDEARQRA